MIEALIFDLGKVLIPFDFGRGYKAIAGLCRYQASDIPARISRTDLVQRFECGQVAPKDFLDELSRILEFEMEYDKFCEIWSSIFLPETLIPEEMIESLHRSRKVLLLSNTNAIHFDMIRNNYPILRHFDDFVLSYQVGALKPSPRIYREAIARAGCAPQECFFTDDIADYVSAAKKEGIDAVQFQSLGQLQQELKQRGIEW